MNKIYAEPATPVAEKMKYVRRLFQQESEAQQCDTGNILFSSEISNIFREVLYCCVKSMSCKYLMSHSDSFVTLT